MNAYDQIIQKQIEWAKNKGISLIGSEVTRGRKSYTKYLKENLFQQLSPKTRAEINNGDGGELNETDGNPVRMQALHSSSSLGVNIFEYWRLQDDLSAITNSCKLTRTKNNFLGQILFEAQYPIDDRFNKSPNLDVVILPDTHSCKVFAIECKFTEPYSSYEHGGVDKKYFDNDGIWSGLAGTKELAQGLSPKDNVFHHLHAAQLIKHILGLNRKYGPSKYRLLYLWYDANGIDGYNHLQEINRFKEIVASDGVKFSAITYQELICRLSNYRDIHPEYISYITNRYL